MFVAFVVGLPAAATAHAPLQEQVRAVSAEILAHPGSGERLLERAELHRRLGDAEHATADYEAALLLQPDLTAVWLGRARLLLAQGEADSALAAVERYLARADDSIGFLVRSRALAALGRPLEAAADVGRAIERHSVPDPSLYLERARRLAETGPDGAIAALDAIDDGQARLGVLASLQWPAIEWELALGRPDAALGRLDALEPWYDRREAWLAARGDVLLRAGRVFDAQAAYTEAWEDLAALPGAQRDAPAARRLRERLEAAMHLPGGDR